MTALNPYLNFPDGRTREAMEFYASVFGGDLDIVTYGDHGLAEDPAQADLVMHSNLQIDATTAFAAADMPPDEPHRGFAGFGIALSGPRSDEAKLEAWHRALGDGGEVVQEFLEAPWGDRFGSVNDRYGVNWMFNCGDPQA